MKRARVLYLGLPLGALCLLHDGHELAAACISRPDQPGLRRLRKKASFLGFPVLERPDLERARVQSELRSFEADLIACWFWTKRVPLEVIELVPFAFNVHPSLLPRHRGADPYFWAIAEGDRVTGVTAHALTERYDEGPILAQRELAIPEGIDAWRLARKLDRPSLALMREIVLRHAAGEPLEAVPQDDLRATQAPEPSDEDCELRFDRPARELERLVRAAAPWPGAFTEHAGETIVVLEARVVTGPEGLGRGQGARTSDGVVIATSDAALLVTAARAEAEDDVLRGPDVGRLFAALPRLGPAGSRSGR
ncbi:MAG: hypothetical protein K8H88_20530 [Sandaracinaceae bacterium]|nr:hypothetical protein [Sandaracinaceae bacterium]